MRYRFCVISLITILITFVMCPIIKTQSFVYADSTTDQWEDVTTNEELAEAFRYYCKSRNLTIDGSIASGITAFTTSTFNSICQSLGIDITALQANLKKSTDSNGRLQFLFDSTGISTYNRIFAEFLQNNDLTEGETVDNKIVYSGEIFTDADGNQCLVFYITSNNLENSRSIYYQNSSNYISAYGSYLKYSTIDLVALKGIQAPINWTSSFTTTETIYTGPRINPPHWYYTSLDWTNGKPNCGIIQNTGYGENVPLYQGYYSVARLVNSMKYYAIIYSYYGNVSSMQYIDRITIDNENLEETNIYITTNNTTINNNNYEGDTIINNEGDTGGESGGGESGGGESGGGESGGDTNIDIDFPDFNFPNIPNIDFNLGDLSHKFPFSIPFDLVAFFTVLNADPIAPAIDRTIPLPDPIDDWHFQADFSQFDDYAVIIRNVEYIGFVIGLIYLTVRFVKG